MTTTFKTIFETAREEGEATGIEKGINIGEAKGLEKGDTKAVKALIRTTQLSDNEIAKELEVSVDFVKKIRKELNDSPRN